MFAIPRYRSPISLIPGGCPQLLDYQAPLSSLESVKYAFEEQPAPAGSERKVILHAYRRNEEKEFQDEIDPSLFYDGSGYEMSGVKEIQPWLGQWMPIPFLRVREQNWEDGEGCRFEYGPSNWARARLSVDPQNSEFLRLALVFDMQVEEKTPDIYAALTPEDIDASAHYRLAWRLRDNSWFLDLPWVEEWLSEVWSAHRNAGRRRPVEDERVFAHIASFLTYLECVRKVCDATEVFVVRPDSEGSVNVDLVLDIGNSRTTGILVETQPQRPTNLNDSYLLQLRDISSPEFVYTEPFETRVEFCESSFGNDALSLRSGRRTPAFVWPSPVRIGPEASRLATLSRSGKGSTGMSSPKRYLWDERDWERSWRFNTQSEKSPYVTRGPLAQRVNSSGTPICCMDDPLFKRNKNLKNQERESAFESHFTRSSLMMFLLVEIIQQALLTINSPGQRQRRDQPDKPRRLRQIIFTVPAGMPLAEQKIYKRWAKWAVAVLWEALGWQQYYNESNKTPGYRKKNAYMDYRTSPVIRCDWDEATCTQLVYIYNEITRQFQGDAELFCRLMGRKRKINGTLAPSVRVAAIDIGGGTTDLSITTFELASGASSTPRIAPHPEFHDGFNLAGDDVLKNVVREQFFPALGNALKTAGIPDVETAMATLFGRDMMDTSQDVQNGRIQFVRQVAVPAGLCLIDLYEHSDPIASSASVSFKLSDCFTQPAGGDETSKSGKQQIFSRTYPAPAQTALNYVNEFVAKKTGNDDFNVLDTEIVMYPTNMNDTVETTLEHILANLAEVIKLYECDVLLLTGRPSCWPGIMNKLFSLVPVPPGRIFPMAEYRVAGWYPFSDARGKISDPKTTVVVGAILCALAEGQLEGFSFDPHTLLVHSTARYIGQMELNEQIKKEKVWFKVDPVAETVEPKEAEITFSGPISVGFRQLSAERWTTTRYYFLDFINEEGRRAHGDKELKVTLQLLLGEDDASEGNIDQRDEGEFEIVEIRDAASGDDLPGLLEMRLQTLSRHDGFWMDTGVVKDDEINL